MQVISNEHVVCFDVDDTLVIWDDSFQAPELGRVRIEDPYDGHTVYLKPHVRHVKLLRQMKGRGRFLVVWSAAGAQWAKAVIQALELEDCVDLIQTKPLAYVDDLPVTEWIGKRIYLPSENS
jgi:predicted phosphatase